MYFCNICLIILLSLYSFTLIYEHVAETTSVCHLIILHSFWVSGLCSEAFWSVDQIDQTNDFTTQFWNVCDTW